jgi:hypothetical protein
MRKSIAQLVRIMHERNGTVCACTRSRRPMSGTQSPFLPPYVTSEDRVVIVLGAGASISEMESMGSRDHLPPTDTNFLLRTKECVPSAYQKTKTAFDALWNGDEPRPLHHQRMEEVFSSAYLRVQQTSGRSREGIAARELYDTLVETLRYTLSRTTRCANPSQHVELFKLMLKPSPKSFDIVSFNYDVLADRALRRLAAKTEWRWNPHDGYGFRPHGQSEPRQRSQIRLLKLHGSMNWYIPTPKKRRANVYQKNTRVYVPTPASRLDAAAWQRMQRSLGHSSTSVFPLMVPPVFEKGTQIVGVLNKLWDETLRILSEATVVVVWGYSLPITDYHADVLFSRGARRAKNRLVVVNPDRTALSRVTDVCGHAWNRWYFKVSHLLREMRSGSATDNDPI